MSPGPTIITSASRGIVRDSRQLSSMSASLTRRAISWPLHRMTILVRQVNVAVLDHGSFVISPSSYSNSSRVIRQVPSSIQPVAVRWLSSEL